MSLHRFSVVAPRCCQILNWLLRLHLCLGTPHAIMTAPSQRSLSCVSYSSMSANCSSRLLDIIGELSRDDIIILSGTKWRTKESYTCFRLQGHAVYNFGWNTGFHTNKSAGVIIMIKRASIPQASLVRVFTPPKQLQGRFGGLHFRTGASDLFIYGSYWPPDCGDQSRATVQKLTNACRRNSETFPLGGLFFLGSMLMPELGCEKGKNNLITHCALAPSTQMLKICMVLNFGDLLNRITFVWSTL